MFTALEERVGLALTPDLEVGAAAGAVPHLLRGRFQSRTRTVSDGMSGYGGAALNSSPMSYELDGWQYVLMGVDGVLYAWALPQ